MASVTLHHDGRIEIAEPPTAEEIAAAEEGLRRVAAALMGMAVEQLEREDRERAAAERTADLGGADPGDTRPASSAPKGRGTGGHRAFLFDHVASKMRDEK